MLKGGRLRLNNTNNRAPLKNYPNNVKKNVQVREWSNNDEAAANINML